MLHLLGLVISIGIADGINPSSIGPALYLAGGPRPRRSVRRFTAGYAGVLLIGGLVLTLGPGGAILALVPRPSLTTRYILETVAGAAMLVGAGVLWQRRKDLEGHEQAAGSNSRRDKPVVMGATISAVELPTAFPYFAAIAAIVGSGLNVAEQVILVAIYNLCFVLPLLGILATLAVAGDRALELLTRAKDWTHERWPVLVAVVLVVAGAFVTVLGITGLTRHARGNAGRVSRGLRDLLTRPG
jgi:cytochrome c biogenesis protein CcdA